MKNYSNFNTRGINDRLKSAGKRIYSKQLDRVEGEDIEINGTLVRGIVYNDLNVYGDKEYRTITLPLEVEVKNGDYIKYRSEYYINTNDIDYHYVYQSFKATKCNQLLKWKGLPPEWTDGFPCHMSNDSYGSKQNRSSDFISEIDTKMKIIVQQNEWTRQIKRDMRFIFNNSEFDIFRVTDITTSTKSGLISIIASKDTMRIEDDLENNLAFNEPRIHDVEKPKKDYVILGEETVKTGRTYTYNVEPADNVTFVVDDDDIAEIKNTTGSSCDVYIKMKNEVFTLSIVDNNNVLNSKVIYTVK